MLRIFVSIFFAFFLIIFPMYVSAQAFSIPQCPPSAPETNPFRGLVQTDVPDDSPRRDLPPDVVVDTRTLLSDDKKARFTIDVNRDLNALNLGIVNWYMQWQCGVSIPGKDFINTKEEKARFSTETDGTDNIHLDIDNAGTLNNRCEFDPKNNPIRVVVKVEYAKDDSSPTSCKATGDSGHCLADFCQANYEVFDAERLCKLYLTDSARNRATNITPASDLEVSGKGLTKESLFVLLLDNKPVWSDVTQIGVIIKQDRFDRVDPGKTSGSFDGRKIKPNLLTIGPHSVSLHRFLNNPLLEFIHGSNVDKTQLCSVVFTVGDASKPGSIISETGGDLTTNARFIPCVGSECAKSEGGTRCDEGAISTAIGCIHTSPVGFTKDFLRFMLGIGGGLAFLMMLLGAFQMITSAGNPDTLNAARERMTSAVIGLLFIIFAVLLLQIIGVGILNIPGFT